MLSFKECNSKANYYSFIIKGESVIGRCESVSHCSSLIMSCRDLISSVFSHDPKALIGKEAGLDGNLSESRKNTQLQFPPICICLSHVSVCVVV